MQAARLLSAQSREALRLAFERDSGLRIRRLAAATADASGQRLRPTRPRMRALIASPGGKLAWRSVPGPSAPGAHQAIVRPLAVATCDLDRPLILGATPFPLPLRLGHECVAEVLRVGSEVSGVRPGQRVVVPFQISCGTCPPCRRGRTGNCASVPPVSMYGFGLAGGHWGGALSDELLVPFADAMLVPLPDGIDPVAAASVADNVSDGYRHVAPHLPQLLDDDAEAEVLIVAAVTRRPWFNGSVALYAGLAALASGARSVWLADTRTYVRQHAQRLGLRALLPRDVRGRSPFPLVAEISGEPQGLQLALSLTAPDGRCSSVGSLHTSARIPMLRMYARNVTLQVSRTHVRALIPKVLELMASARLRPELVTTTVASFDDAPAALVEHVNGDSVKTVLLA